MSYFPLDMESIFDIPMNALDPQYALSFDALKDIEVAKEFFVENGYVVLSNVYDEVQCTMSRNAMWDVLEEDCAGLSRYDMDSWDSFKSTGKYGTLMINSICT